MNEKTPFMQVVARNENNSQRTARSIQLYPANKPLVDQEVKETYYHCPTPEQLCFCPSPGSYCLLENETLARQELARRGIKTKPVLGLYYDLDNPDEWPLVCWHAKAENGETILPVFDEFDRLAEARQYQNPAFEELHAGEMFPAFTQTFIVIAVKDQGLTIRWLTAIFHAKLAAQKAYVEQPEPMEFVLCKVYSHQGFHHYLGTYWLGYNADQTQGQFIPFWCDQEFNLPRNDEELNQLYRHGLGKNDIFSDNGVDFKLFGDMGTINGLFALPIREKEAF